MKYIIKYNLKAVIATYMEEFFLKVSKKIRSGLYANDMIKLDEMNKFLLKI